MIEAVLWGYGGVVTHDESGEHVRHEMVHALDSVQYAGYLIGCLADTLPGGPGLPGRSPEVAAVLAKFDAIVDARQIGTAKPNPRLLEIACTRLGVQASACVVLEHLDRNLAPAATMGMRTIKVTDPHDALHELSALLDGLPMEGRCC